MLALFGVSTVSEAFALCNFEAIIILAFIGWDLSDVQRPQVVQVEKALVAR